MNNQTNKIVNLSHLILNKIISYVYDNIDRICFSLVCKRWYNERDKYLIFNSDRIKLFALNSTDTKKNHKHFKLTSYNNIFKKSIQSKTISSLFVGNKNYSYCDYHFNDIRKLNSIPNNVSNIYIDIRFKLFADELKHLYQLISESQSVTMLDGCSTLKYGLPKSIKTIRFKHFNEPLVKGSLPNSIEELVFNSNFKQEILPGVLPEGLSKLKIYSYQYEIRPGVLPVSLLEFTLDNYHYEIHPGVLPASLLKFTFCDCQGEIRPGALPDGLLECHLNSYEFEIKPGVLPNGLLEFSLESNNYRYEMQPGVLPLSLECLSLNSHPSEDELPPTLGDQQYPVATCLPISWLQAISSLPNLQKLYVFFSNDVNEDTILNLDYLPPTLEFLEYLVPKTILKGTMPTSLKSIDLDECQFKIDEIFPETLQYHLEMFQYRNKIIHSIPSNIKIETLSMTGNSSEPKITLPSGVENIYLLLDWTNSGEKIIDFGGDGNTDQACSLRKVAFSQFDNGTPQVKLPNTVEFLDLGYNDLDDNILQWVPSSVKTLKTPKINITIPKIKSITNIIRNFILFQTIRKLDENYYLIYGDYESIDDSVNIIAKIFHHSKLEKILGTKIE
ncbi:hypothetical protein PPL_10920 [Heterostelium album PN500]|uniref:COI1 F-box domain-containing protein n=1 Tax=Heterostelium pallidum (strain ATCC 26659 / Pp 5 / PN500) TaxID=670386 RepID=D3BSF3_HETP5|nr:hypothetical protein PPL_10920 [Heterostelium album PN500]EFA75659.1 hypothetical protein PPL_10920 [Heterostelium album PN500]|eukprot:XP_020427793.1 hypothetical protein PPL_10920 [Heterostelium album PN500]